MAYLDIEEKEDSIEKLAAVEGKPTKHYLFAPEFNLVKNSINTLRMLINMNYLNIDFLLSGAAKVELGNIEDNFIDVINSFFAINLNPPVFVTFTKDDVFYVKAFAGNAGTYGTNSGLTVEASDFLDIYQSGENESSISDRPVFKLTDEDVTADVNWFSKFFTTELLTDNLILDLPDLSNY